MIHRVWVKKTKIVKSDFILVDDSTTKKKSIRFAANTKIEKWHKHL